MGRRASDYQYGPSWVDVMDYVRELETNTHRKVTIKIVPWVGNIEPSSFAVVVYLIKTLTPTWAKEEVYAHGHYPCNDHKTMTGLVLSLLHQAEFKWTEEYSQALRQASF
jgi:hypothetical protein